MSLKELATSFLVGALIAALAIGAYLWIGTSDAHTVQPGSFTEVDGGAMIGAEADAIDQPVDVEVEWVDPTGEEAFQYHGDQIEDVDRVLEVSTTDTEEGEPWLEASRGSTFVVALPVPERFDTSNLAPIGFSYGEYVVPAPGGAFVPNGSELPDTWGYLDGAFVPDERMLLVAVPNLGTPDQPTRVGVVEHAYLETPVAPDTAQTEDQTATPSEAQIASIGGSPGLASEHVHPASGGKASPSTATDRFVSHEAGTALQLTRQALGEEVGQVEVDVTGAEGFQLLCYLDDCSQDRVIQGETIGDRVDAVETALQAAVPLFESLEGQQGPEILPSVHQANPTEERYPLRLHGPHAGPGGSDQKCASVSGFYNPMFRQAVVCLDGSPIVLTDHSVMPSLQATQETAAHELFHAYQFGMQGGGFGAADYDTSVLEGTTMLAQGVEEPTDLSRTLWPPQLTRSITDTEVQNDYRAEYLWHHLYENEGVTFEQSGQLFQQGLELENADTFITDRTSLDGIGDAYWEFAKDLAYEDKGPELRPPNPTTEAGTCELFEGEDWAPSLTDAIRLPHPGALEVDEHTISIDPDTLGVDVGNGGSTIKTSLGVLESDVYEFEYDLTGSTDDGFWVRVTLEPQEGTDDPEMRMKLYDAENEGTEECWEDDQEAALGDSAGIEIWQGDEEATLIVSNLEHDRDEPAEYRLVFEAFPMWSRTGHNGQRTYWIETPEEGKTQVSTMSGSTAEFQGDDEPGSLKWSASSEGTTRPSYAYDQVYTVHGLGASPGFGGSYPSGSGAEGTVNAYDAETGDIAWKVADATTKLSIGRGPLSGPSGSSDALTGPGLVQEPIAGSGHVYVQGEEAGEIHPPGEPEASVPMGFGGVIALDAEDGSPAWETVMPHEEPNEAPWVDQVVLDEDTLYVKGGVAIAREYETEIVHKLWAVDVETGQAEETWSADLTQAKMVMADGNAIVAGWGSPGSVEVFDPATGQTQWRLEDTFVPPPQDTGGNRDVYTAGITQLVYDQGTVYTGTTIATDDGAHGAVYAFDEAGRKWRYSTEEMSPTPAVNEGTVYAMTGTFNVSGEENPERPSDVAERASILHAVDAAANETRWAVNASTTMTVTDDRVYVGKRAPLTDPYGASVAALDTATGQVVWTNEKDVRGPMALTGAYVDGVLYVNTQASVVALHG